MKIFSLLILVMVLSCATHPIPERDVASDEQQEKSKKNHKFDFGINNLGRR